MTDICHFRALHECPCTDQCQQTVRQPAPVVQASITDILATSVVIGAIAALLAFYSIPRLVEAEHQQQLVNQENAHVSR